MKLVGGMFGLEGDLRPVHSAAPQFLYEPRQLFLNARCAIKYLIEVLRPLQVWLPSYLCCSILDAVNAQQTELQFYPIGYNLETASFDWLNDLQAGDLLVVIDYFGFPCDYDLVRMAHARGALVLEDASQALLSRHVGRHSDFVVFSPRKTVGVPDGGILRSIGTRTLPPARLIAPPPEWWLTSLESCLARREFDKHGGERVWFDLFRRTEAEYPLGAYRMSELTEILLNGAFDYDAIAATRRANYACLASLLTEYAVLPFLDAETVPLGFPVRIGSRDSVRQLLFDHAVYPPVHWDICTCVPVHFSESHRLSSQTMTIPCDQRYSIADMERISDLIGSAIGLR